MGCGWSPNIQEEALAAIDRYKTDIMARDWTWKKLEDRQRDRQRHASSRRPDYMENASGLTVRYHVPHPRTEAAERFAAMTRQVDAGLDQTCLVFTGGATFRVDDDTVTTPRRFIYEYLMEEKLPRDVRLRTLCRTPKCCRIAHIISFTNHRFYYRTPYR